MIMILFIFLENVCSGLRFVNDNYDGKVFITGNFDQYFVEISRLCK